MAHTSSGNFLLAAIIVLNLKLFAPGQCELTELSPTESYENRRYGRSVALDGAVVVIGHGPTGGVAGSACVYRYHRGGWVEEQRLAASGGAPSDQFGWSVAIWRDVILVGNPIGPPSAFVFRHDGRQWIEEQRLIASDGPWANQFGAAVSMSQDVALVGAYWDDPKGDSSGSVYVFRYDGSTWIEEQKLSASDGGLDHEFGRSVSVSGNVAVIGAPGAPPIAAGAVYVFSYDGQMWIEEQKLNANDPVTGARFGYSASISNNVIATSEFRSQTDLGAVYVFRHNGIKWIQEQQLVPRNLLPSDDFGQVVSVDGDVIVISATKDDDAEWDAGAAYVYRYDGNAWQEGPKLLASDGMEKDLLGRCAIHGELVAVSALGNDDIFDDSGSLYLFALGGPDCDNNGRIDLCDIVSFGTSSDLDSNFVPDFCEQFKRGDANGDGITNGVADGVFILQFGFVPGSPTPPCLDAADADDNSEVSSLSDGLYILNYFFSPPSPPPPCPGPSFCGSDPTADYLTCEIPPCP